ncbi:MAG: hypothetical protein EOO27_31040 [Comamonadaceae bacterium]|nr:MAG: hypothetical protein EOO27_31040 [Comamonadaceae bacterium]
MVAEKINRRSRGAAGAVAAVATVQVVVAALTAVGWYFSTVFAGGGCAPRCDWVMAETAFAMYIAGTGLSFVATIGACAWAWRSGRDLTWVPLAGSAVIVACFFGALGLFTSAMT